jgi:hypothetical protein
MRSFHAGKDQVKVKIVTVITLVLVLASAALAFEMKPYQIKEDFGTEPLYDCVLQYYYYIPCPTYSWFWAFALSIGDMIGVCFDIGDQGTGGWGACDPSLCQSLEPIRILDFAVYGTVYPGLFTIEFDAYWAHEPCCGPAQPFIHLWNSGPLETSYGWNYFRVEPPLCLGPCCLEYQPPSSPSIVITATHTGSEGTYPAWGLDNISTPLEAGCVMHDIGCIEPAWRIYLACNGPTNADPSTWGSIKAMYE